VRYVLASTLVNELVESADDKQLSKTIARYGRVDLLICDELGYLELDRRGAELLFQVLTEREEKSAIAIASNEPFSGWTKTFTDRGSAPPSLTGSPSTGRSSSPVRPATAWPTRGRPSRPHRPDHVGHLEQGQRPRSAPARASRAESTTR
jgi:hypothetical protein